MYCKGQEVFGKWSLESIAQKRQKDTTPPKSPLFNDYKPKRNKYSNFLVIKRPAKLIFAQYVQNLLISNF